MNAAEDITRLKVQGNPITDAPIYLNMDGTFALPRGAGRFVVGEINPDLRLHKLDAFLEQMDEAMNPDTSRAIDRALATVLAKIRRELSTLVGEATCKLVIGCQVNPRNRSMEYTFEVRASAKGNA